jgi:hypothetical protein
MKKIIFISGTPISNIQGDKLNIPWFAEHDVEIEYWNLTNIYYSNKSLEKYFGGHPEFRFKFPTEINFYNIIDVKLALHQLKPHALFCFYDFIHQANYWLLREFKKNKIQYFIGPRRTSHVHGNNNKSLFLKALTSIFDGSLFEKIKSKESNIDNYFITKIKQIVFLKTNFYQKPSFVMGSGSFGRNEWSKLCLPDDFISVRSFDICWDVLPKLNNEKYCVYIDESIIYSPDRGLYEPNKHNSASSDFKIFKKNMCRVFDIIEKSLGCKVLIAASGKYKYNDSNIYGGRKIIYDKTNQLIQHSELVLCHTSTGVYQAIIDKIKIVLLHDDTFTQYKKKHIDLMANLINIIPVNSGDIQESDIVDACTANSKIIEAQYFREEFALDSYHNSVLEFLDRADL